MHKRKCVDGSRVFFRNLSLDRSTWDISRDIIFLWETHGDK